MVDRSTTWRTVAKSAWTRIALGFAAGAALLSAVNPTFGPAIDVAKVSALVLAAIAWIAAELFTERESAAQVHAHDRDLYDQFAALFDTQTTDFLKHHDFGFSWERSAMRPVFELARWDGEALSFEDKRLQASLSACKALAVELAKVLAYDTGPHQRSPDQQTAEEIDPETGDSTAHARRTFKQLNDLSSELYEAVDSLKGRARKVGISVVARRQ